VGEGAMLSAHSNEIDSQVKDKRTNPIGYNIDDGIN